MERCGNPCTSFRLSIPGVAPAPRFCAAKFPRNDFPGTLVFGLVLPVGLAFSSLLAILVARDFSTVLAGLAGLPFFAAAFPLDFAAGFARRVARLHFKRALRPAPDGGGARVGGARRRRRRSGCRVEWENGAQKIRDPAFPIHKIPTRPGTMEGCMCILYISLIPSITGNAAERQPAGAQCTGCPCSVLRGNVG